MSSPELIKKQLERWVKNKSEGNASTINIEQTKKEVASLKSQEDRYVKAYGSGVISVDQLKEFTVPLKEKVLILNDQLAKAQSETSYPKGAEMPKLAQIEEFASVAKVTLANLSFEAKQGIIKALVDKIVGTRLELQINGYIPITQNINDCTLNRHCRTSKRWKIDTL
jgi:site-specific DNA recombinase